MAMSMRFFREIPESKIVDKVINDLTQHGFTLVWKVDSVEVYAEVSDNDEYRKAA